VKLFIFLWIAYFYEQSEKIDVETRRWGDREIERLGDWEIGRLGDWEIGRLGDWEIGRLEERQRAREGGGVILNM
jgi:hypothetical protein